MNGSKLLLPLNLWLIFISFSYLNQISKGEDTPLECPDSVITKAQTIQSPLYNEGYFANFRCWYNITAPEGERIKVTFTDFNLPPSKVLEHVNYHMFDEGCQTDFVQWWESTDQKEETGRFCGEELNGKFFKTFGNNLRILFQSFVTDKQFKGFKAEISFINEDNPSICQNIINTAGTFETGQIEGSKKCKFTVKSPLGKLPHANPVTVSSQNAGSKCLRVVHTQDNGYEENNKLKAKKTTCNPNVNNKITKQKNVQLVNFEISVKQSEGYSGQIEVSFIDPILYCGGEVTGTISLSSKDISTGRYIVCAWTIKKNSAAENLELEVTTNLEEPARKDYDTKICMKDQVLAFAHNPDPRSYTSSNWRSTVSEPICGSKTSPIRIKKLDTSAQSHHVTVMSIMTLDKSKEKSISFSIK